MTKDQSQSNSPPYSGSGLTKGIFHVIAIVIPAIVSGWILLYIGDTDNLSYVLGSESNIALTKDASDTTLLYNKQKIPITTDGDVDLRILNFTLRNDSFLSIENGQRLILVTGDDIDQLVPAKAVLNHKINVQPSSYGFGESSVRPIVETQAIYPEISQGQRGYGVELISSVPGNTAIGLTFILDVARYPNLLEKQIELRISPRGNTQLHRLLNSEFINIETWNFIFWIIASASVYSLAWMLANLFSGNHSTGVKILAWVIRKIFKKEIL